jgi:hypothetical protein
MSSLKKVALICFDNPYVKPMSGGKRAMLTRIESLSLLEVDLEVFLLTNPDEGLADLEAVNLPGRCHVHQYFMQKIPSIATMHKYPICVARRYVAEVTKELTGSTYDAVIYEGAQVGAYRFENDVKARKHILYYHDIESVYRAELAKSERSPIRRYLQKRESKLFARMEEQSPELFDSHLFVSCDECAEFGRARGLGISAKYAPYAVNYIVDNVVTKAVPGRILYVGDMALDNNYRSVEWFIKSVLPKISVEGMDIELRLVGRISDKRKVHLESLDARVRALGYVDNLEAEYENAACMISPILYGAGVKVKLIDALAHGQIVIANTKACEGTRLMEGENLLIADDSETMAELCCSVLIHRDEYIYVAENGLKFIRQYHSKEAQAELLKREIES